MKKIKDILFNKWTLTVLTALAIILLVYFIGPLFSFADWTPLASETARWICIAIILASWQAIRFVKFVKAKNEESGFLDNLFAKQSLSETDQKVKDEQKNLEAKFKEAINQLKKSSKSLKYKFNLYDIPWYIIIGPPGSGKTTALINSGLKFPLSKEHGTGSIQGIGGTRNCDWWFTDKGILIDTAGRYTTQDSHQEVDSAAWKDFLNLLKKFRNRRPINGVFVTISLQELMLQTADQRSRHIASISNRLQELKDHFQVQFPVYVLLTKADLISGFEEYFDNLSVTEREQVWGITFDYNKNASDSSNLDSFSTEFDKLLKTLNTQLIRRINQERDPVRSVKIASFSKQLQSVKPLIEDFLKDVFSQSRYSQPLLLRGSYLCSGTQEGTPIDRLMNRLSSTPTIPNSNQGKSYFIKNLFENIVFRESNLVGSDTKLERQLGLFNSVAIIGIVLFSACLIFGWSVSYSNNKTLITQTSDELNKLHTLIDALPASETSATQILPILNAARRLPGSYDSSLQSPPWSQRLGLYQGDKLGDSTLSTYEKVLNKVLLSRLIVDTEDQMSQSNQERSLTYAALRTYLMLGSEEHYKAEDVSSFYQLTWLQKQAEYLTTEEYEQLTSHIDILFKNRPIPLPVVLDQELIAQTQRSLLNAPLVETIFGRIAQINVEGVTPFNIYERAGQQFASAVFVRKSGLSLSHSLSPLYTKTAYKQIVNTEIPKLTDEVVKESWVYGDSYQHSKSIDKPSLIKGATELYQEKYVQAYRELLADIDIYPFTNFESAANVLHILSGESNPSPLVQLLESVKKETDFSSKALIGAIAENNKFKQAKEKLKQMIGSSTDVKPQHIPQNSNPISNAFSPLNNLLPEGKENQGQINSIIEKVLDLNNYMSRLAATSQDGAIEPGLMATGEEYIQKLKQVAQTQPKLFVSPYLKGIASRTSNLTFGGTMARINNIWSQGPYRSCSSAVDGNFPFHQNARSEIKMSDFGEIFGYGGVLDKFFEDNLKQYVDTSSSPWRVRSSHRKSANISSEALKAFENAHYIRKAFFKKGEDQVNLSFSLTPKQLDDGLRGFYLTIDGQEISYEFGPLLADTLNWPGNKPGSGASIFLKQVSNKAISINEQGDWAWFKLLRKMKLKQTNNNSRFEIDFKASGYQARYELTADKSYSPYRLGSRIKFRCPKAL